MLSPALPVFGDIVRLLSQVLLQYSCAPSLQTCPIPGIREAGSGVREAALCDGEVPEDPNGEMLRMQYEPPMKGPWCRIMPCV